jgi:quinol-cytochrome oxidoreductase complex cytochrome b subunit
LSLASLTAFALALRNPSFRAVALASDDIAVLLLLVLCSFFTWLSAARAVENDRRAAEGRPPAEKDDARRVFVWPDLISSELVCALAVLALLVAWSVTLCAPLEAPANPAITLNPSKAPWYFLSLQELLFYSDSWLAGVAVPCLAILGLMALPYLDFNPAGNGYCTISQRRFAYVVFQFGFWQLGILLIVIGTFFRGPNRGTARVPGEFLSADRQDRRSDGKACIDYTEYSAAI